MSRDIASAILGAPLPAAESLNPLLDRQIAEARGADGGLDLHTLLKTVSAHYDVIDGERRGVVRSMQLMSDEAQALTREIREQTDSHLQAILDNVKDAIVTLNERGCIETINPTGERIFGYSQGEILGSPLEALLPDVAGGAADFLERFAARIDDTHVDLAAHQTFGLTKGGSRVAVEIAVSKARLDWRDGYIVSIRDITERHLAEQSMRESEARYRTLVEHAPEAIAVFDVDAGKFVDVNDNACRFFKMSRAELLASGPERITPSHQPDGTPSFGRPRGYIERALSGDAPVFEWLHCDASGRTMPCEVRFVRLPSSNGRLIRASITDITERKRAEAIAAGERTVLEKIAANAPLSASLESICVLVEQVVADSFCAISLLDPGRNMLRYAVAPHLPREFAAAMDGTPAQFGYGSCAAAVRLCRAVATPDIDGDAGWESRRDAARYSGMRACWSTPIAASDGQIVGTVAAYRRRPGALSVPDEELMARMAPIAGIAIERRTSEDALRDSEVKFRGLFESMMEGVYQTSREGRILVANPAFVKLMGYGSADELQAVSAKALYWNSADRDTFTRRMESEGELRNQEYILRRKDGSMLVVLDSSRVVLDHQGRVTGYEGTLTDITERKVAETAIFQAKERAQVTLQSIGDAVITTDAEGRIDYMNPVAESLTG